MRTLKMCSILLCGFMVASLLTGLMPVAEADVTLTIQTLPGLTVYRFVGAPVGYIEFDTSTGTAYDVLPGDGTYRYEAWLSQDLTLAEYGGWFVTIEGGIITGVSRYIAYGGNLPDYYLQQVGPVTIAVGLTVITFQTSPGLLLSSYQTGDLDTSSGTAKDLLPGDGTYRYDVFGTPENNYWVSGDWNVVGGWFVTIAGGVITNVARYFDPAIYPSCPYGCLPANYLQQVGPLTIAAGLPVLTVQTPPNLYVYSVTTGVVLDTSTGTGYMIVNEGSNFFYVENEDHLDFGGWIIGISGGEIDSVSRYYDPAIYDCANYYGCLPADYLVQVGPLTIAAGLPVLTIVTEPGLTIYRLTGQYIALDTSTGIVKDALPGDGVYRYEVWLSQNISLGKYGAWFVTIAGGEITGVSRYIAYGGILPDNTVRVLTADTLSMFPVTWKNHGQFVSTISNLVEDSPQISDEEEEAIISGAAKSKVGMPVRSNKPGNGWN